MTAMLLATKCPHCKTTFKVANDQLKLQSGLVRCGICNQVFNGIEHLAATGNVSNTIKINAPAAPSTSSSTSPTAPASSVASPRASAAEFKSEPLPNAEEVKPVEAVQVNREFDLFDEFKISSETSARIEPVLEFDKAEPQLADTFFPSLLNDEFTQAKSKADIEAKVQALLDADLHADYQLSRTDELSDDAVEEIILAQPQADEELQNEPATDLRSMLGNYSDTESVDNDDEDDGEDGEITQLNFIRQANAKKRTTILFSLATVLLLLLLIGQVVYQFRDLIAASMPSSKESLVSLCKLARCEIHLPAQLDAISYEADELHTLPRDNTLEFSLLMRNHSSLPQAWPHIELTLKDNQKQVVLKRVFGPEEYLSSPRDVANGFAANQEQPVKLYFVVDHVKASDYVVAIFYP